MSSLVKFTSMVYVRLKGYDKLREKLPTYHGRRIIIIPIFFGIFFSLGIFFQIFLYFMSRTFPNNTFFYLIGPILPFFGPILLMSTGLFFVSRIWSKKEKLLLRSKTTAYQKGFLYGMIGIPFVLSTIFHAYLPIETLLTTNPINPLASFFSSSLLVMVPGFEEYEIIVRIMCGSLFFIIGLLTIIQALLTFGIDYMAVVYVYYPEESELENQRIYSVLRHPTYFGVILIALSGLFIRFSLYSIVSFLSVFIGLYIHILAVEEKELIERFGDAFLEYRKKVPALLLKPRNITTFIKFILHRK